MCTLQVSGMPVNCSLSVLKTRTEKELNAYALLGRVMQFRVLPQSLEKLIFFKLNNWRFSALGVVSVSNYAM